MLPIGVIGVIPGDCYISRRCSVLVMIEERRHMVLPARILLQDDSHIWDTVHSFPGDNDHKGRTASCSSPIVG